jgi:hypothetical protein
VETSRGSSVAPAAAAATTVPLARPDGRVRTLVQVAEAAPILVLVAERDCPTSRAAVRAVAGAGGSVVVVSQGLAAAAVDLIEVAEAHDVEVLVETAPYPVSSGLEVATVPTFVLLDGDGSVRDRQEGWDRDRVTALLAAVGGDVPGDDDLGPHRPGCQSRSTFDATTRARLEADDAALAGDEGRIEDLWELGWHDGLPVVPPTRSRVRAMLDGRDPDAVFGTLGPSGGVVTAQRLAVCAVLAGCEPRGYPIVAAAARAVLDPAFNAHGMTNTTHSASPYLLVSGPAAASAGLHGGSNVLGPGSRANATIGRAIRLLLQLTGGGTPGTLDQSALGGPHKFGACFPEREDASPWGPLRSTLGFAEEVSTVTVIGGEAPTSVSDHTSEDATGVARTLAMAMSTLWSPTWYPLGTTAVLLVCSEHARTFGDAGWSKDDLRRFIVDHAVRTVGELQATGSGERTPFATHGANPDDRLAKFASIDEVLPIVAGGDAGRFSATIGPWVGFGLGSRPVTEVIDDAAGPTCTAATTTTRRIGT